jgi:LysM domain
MAVDRFPYCVRHGDSLWSIAEHQLGDAQRWPEIIQLNSLRPPYKILIGQPLLIPDRMRSSNAVIPHVTRSSKPTPPLIPDSTVRSASCRFLPARGVFVCHNGPSNGAMFGRTTPAPSFIPGHVMRRTTPAPSFIPAYARQQAFTLPGRAYFFFVAQEVAEREKLVRKVVALPPTGVEAMIVNRPDLFGFRPARAEGLSQLG